MAGLQTLKIRNILDACLNQATTTKKPKAKESIIFFGKANHFNGKKDDQARLRVGNVCA